MNTLAQTEELQIQDLSDTELDQVNGGFGVVFFLAGVYVGILIGRAIS